MSLTHCSHVSGIVCVGSAEKSVIEGSIDHKVFLFTYIWPIQRIYKSLFMHKRDQISNSICTQNKNGVQATRWLSTGKHKSWHSEKSAVNTVWTRI